MLASEACIPEHDIETCYHSSCLIYPTFTQPGSPSEGYDFSFVNPASETEPSDTFFYYFFNKKSENGQYFCESIFILVDKCVEHSLCVGRLVLERSSLTG